MTENTGEYTFHYNSTNTYCVREVLFIVYLPYFSWRALKGTKKVIGKKAKGLSNIKAIEPISTLLLISHFFKFQHCRTHLMRSL